MSGRVAFLLVGLTVLAGAAVVVAGAITKPHADLPSWGLAAKALLPFLAILTGAWVVLSVLVALVQAWGDKHYGMTVAVFESQAKDRDLSEVSAEAISLRQQLDQERLRNTPNMHIEPAAQVLWGPDSPQGLILTMTLLVKNVPPSAPSALYAYKVWVIKGDQRWLYVPEKIPKQWWIGGVLPNGRTWSDVISGEDSIAEKTIEPVPPGGTKAGWLVVLLSDFKSREQIDEATIVIECFDIWTRSVSCQFTAHTKDFMDRIPMAAGVTNMYTEHVAQGAAVPPYTYGQTKWTNLTNK